MSDNGVFNTFATTKPTFGTKEFLESNSLVAKLAFLLLVVIGFSDQKFIELLVL